MRIVIDAMGSDNHPQPDVAGAVAAAQSSSDEIILVGDETVIKTALANHTTTGLAIEVVHAEQTISMEDKPAEALRQKKGSSIHVGLGLVKDKQADAFVSAGNTGAILAVAMLKTLRRIRGIERPALGVVFPTKEKPMLIDNGANADCKPEYLYQFGLMGSLYVEHVLGIEKPRVALLSNGEEEGKGNQLIKETIPLLANSHLNYIGNMEPKEFVRGGADVGVTDGFTGNLIMKTAESIASYISDLIRDEMMAGPRTILGGLLARPAFARVREQLNPDVIGGAPLLGVDGVVIVGHGRSNEFAIEQAIGQARLAVEKDIVNAIREGLADDKAEDDVAESN